MMDNTTREETQDCFPFGDGSLILQKKVRIPDEYGPLPVLESKALYYQTLSGEMVQASRFQDIHDIAQQFHIDVIKAFSSAPVALARLVADYEDLGTVLLPSWRYDIFQAQYGIDLASNQPRLEGAFFRFLVIDLDITHTPHVVRDVTVDLVNMQIYKREIMEI